MDIDSMPAGPEMDALIAEKVMGWNRWNPEKGDWDGPINPPFFADFDDECGLAVYKNGDEYPTDYFAPSRDIAAAWEVMEKLRQGSFFCDFAEEIGRLCGVDFYKCKPFSLLDRVLIKITPKIICQAALKAVAKVEKATKQES